MSAAGARLDDWPGAWRREPAVAHPSYAMRLSLASWLQEQARRTRELGHVRLLDVGCGDRPYYPYFAPFVETYTGVDVGNPLADIDAPVEDLPLEDSSYDVVLCTQVLEHVDDPARAVRELHRVVAPGGRVLASTHGVFYYHPSPGDHWRWTHTGLERLFRENGDWSDVVVEPAVGTMTTVAMINAVYVNLALRRLHAPWAARLLVRLLNRLGPAIDQRWTSLADPTAATLIANYHVVAVK